MDAQLQEVFAAFAGGSKEMDGRTFVKCLKDARLLDGHALTMVDADLIFAKCKTRGARKIALDEFTRCLAMVATKKGVSMNHTVGAVVNAARPDYESGATCATSAAGASASVAGPERFFYDKSTWTGTHRKGGPTLIGGGVEDGDVVRVSDLVRRDLVLEDGLHRKKMGSSGLPTLLGNDVIVGRRRQNSPRATGEKSTSPGPRRTVTSSVASNGMAKAASHRDFRRTASGDALQSDQTNGAASANKEPAPAALAPQPAPASPGAQLSPRALASRLQPVIFQTQAQPRGLPLHALPLQGGRTQPQLRATFPPHPPQQLGRPVLAQPLAPQMGRSMGPGSLPASASAFAAPPPAPFLVHSAAQPWTLYPVA
uniref:Uncharacterized protein n=1 Tax=Zooxanthella nutricula TaxID=1333877 RepID=A0A7S2PB64_9DINO